MKKLSYLLIIAALFLTTCKNNDDKCTPIPCLAVFNTIRLFTQTQSGVPKELQSISARNMRSSKVYTPLKEETKDGIISYVIATDNDKLDFLENGDRVVVSAITSKKVTIEFIISGGKCTCGISKVSGPNILTVD